jgi:hypothetical protein
MNTLLSQMVSGTMDKRARGLRPAENGTLSASRQAQAAPPGPAALALRPGPMQDTPVRPHTTASCFATYLLPHVLFVASFEERERIAKVCSLAWNIGLFPDAGDRERRIENMLALFFDGEEAPPPGVRQGYGEELRMLADLKRDLFPWQLAKVVNAGLEPGTGPDTLVVDAGGAVERIELALNPSIMALPRITKVLVGMHRDTKAQRGTLEEAQRTPGLLGQVVGRDMLTAYCVQQADLRGYHRMLTTWSEASPAPEMKAGIGRFLLAVDEIEDDTKAVLGILAAALDAPR